MTKVKYQYSVPHGKEIATKEFTTRGEADAWISEQERQSRECKKSFRVMEIESTGAAALSCIFG